MSEQKDKQCLEVYLFKGTDSKLKQRPCLGFKCPNSEKVISEINRFPAQLTFGAVNNPEEWHDVENPNKSYDVVINLGDFLTDSILDKKIDECFKIIKTITSLEPVLTFDEDQK